jgi:hypothetical protein
MASQHNDYDYEEQEVRPYRPMHHDSRYVVGVFGQICNSSVSFITIPGPVAL